MITFFKPLRAALVLCAAQSSRLAMAEGVALRRSTRLGAPGSPARSLPHNHSEPRTSQLSLDDLQLQYPLVVNENRGLRAERAALLAERDRLAAELDGVATERDDLLAERGGRRDDATITMSLYKATLYTLGCVNSVITLEYDFARAILARMPDDTGQRTSTWSWYSC